MARRGSYAKGLAKREQILESALEVIARQGFGKTTIGELADAVGLSKTGLLHHFDSKEELFTEVLRRRDEIGAEIYGDMPETAIEMTERLERLVRHNAAVPGLVRLHVQLSADASDERHPAHGYFLERYRRAKEVGLTWAEHLKGRGQLPADVDPGEVAVLVSAVMDGLQLQWQYDHDLDMARHLRLLARLLGTPTAAKRESDGDAS